MSSASPTIYQTILKEWRDKPEVRAEFGNITAFAAVREREHARSTGLSLNTIRAATADVQDYIAELGRAGPLTAEALDQIGRLARQWNGAPAELRAEFKSFEVFAAYSRAHAAGRITTYSNAAT